MAKRGSKSKKRGRRGWIRESAKKHKRGSLHRMLRVPLGQKIGRRRLREAIRRGRRIGGKWGRLLRMRAQWALNVNAWRSKKRKRSGR